MGQQGCKSAPSCSVQTLVPDVALIEPPIQQCGNAVAELQEGLEGCTSQWTQGDEPDLPDNRPLREYTYAVEGNMMGLQYADEDAGNLSHRSSMSDIERQAEFLRRKLEIAKAAHEAEQADAAGGGSQIGAVVFPPLPAEPGGSKETLDALRAEYKALGINVVGRSNKVK
eukprot:gnl/TRDRNA2_/TRDRNA2_194196_c0_seq1.p1 gnl/TRDRNA2_/TRDRNA2_194196_c0~~gnl/TRDRNA2_/TRDRNA2_194196_c0_seq1.p1  ORF type:complete len:184 (-),score=41.64 gnl/TRDRNA2_/TRDRNA2_194196_c0_seq1:82-591(-)